MPDFRVFHSRDVRVDHRAGEGDQRLDPRVAFLGNILVEGLLVLHRVEAAGSNHHGLSLAADLVLGEVAEVLDHDLGLLGDVVRVKAHEAGQGPGSLSLFHFGIVLNGFDQPVVSLVGDVISEHVKDETLLDGLAHTVKMEGLWFAVRALRSKDLQRLILRAWP